MCPNRQLTRACTSQATQRDILQDVVRQTPVAVQNRICRCHTHQSAPHLAQAVGVRALIYELNSAESRRDGESDFRAGLLGDDVFLRHELSAASMKACRTHLFLPCPFFPALTRDRCELVLDRGKRLASRLERGKVDIEIPLRA